MARGSFDPLNCEQWRPFSPSPTASDSIPIFCGTVSLKEKFDVDLPPVDNFDNLAELLKATMQSPALAHTNRHVSAAETLWSLITLKVSSTRKEKVQPCVSF